MKSLSIITVVLFMYITANAQNVGIGTNAPTGHLHVIGLNTSTQPVIKAQSSYIGTSDVRGVEAISDPAPGYGVGLFGQGGYRGVWAVGNPNGSGLGSTALYGTITNTVPSAKFGVYSQATGPGTNYGAFLTASGGTNNFAVYSSDGNNYMADSLWIGKTTGNTRFDMTGGKGDIDVSEGDFRIGTTTNRLKMGVFTTGTFAGMSRIYSSGTNAMLALGVNNMDLMTLSAANSGTVVIGNGGALPAAATGYKLSVHGKAVCTELMVKSIATWPDYVFEKNYQLMPLNELQAFINKNKHLPNIPPAKEIEQNGLVVGDMQNKMMQKIEELTLYILQQQKQLELQNKKIEELSKIVNNQ